MSQLQTLAQKKRWAKVSKKDRSEIMRKVALIGWSKISKKDRRIHAMKMVAGRNI